ncbi:uncharacterized protein LOC128729315 isoform X2 [Anopheles nili]|uniref:uncharacterized protein LOC128729315 isoform X2 n=1 Tax=Anopheles nili TaxID=185578 RepID=UPI00237B6949|nr:uncharacterized protein LOC128729315 isoform X2 [Anopheles nili]
MAGLNMFDDPLVDESSQYMLDDLQLAAELGKTLLERNKELEATLKHHQNIIDDHVQEIEYLTKQNAALREVNDSRMKIYEQLEVSIQDLERDKYKLALEYQAEKKHVKQLCSNIESLETKVEELSRSLDDARRQAEADRRTKQTERLLGQQQLQPATPPIIVVSNSQPSHASKDAKLNASRQEDGTTTGNQRHTTSSCQQKGGASCVASQSTDAQQPPEDETDTENVRQGDTGLDELTLSEDNEEVLRIMQELGRTQKCLLSEQGKVSELEEQLAAIAQENHTLQSKLLQVHTVDEMKSVHDELSVLEEFRQGPVCTRCLRDLGEHPDNDSIITGTEDDDASLMELIHNTELPQRFRSSVTLEILPTEPDSLDLSVSDCAGPTNPYRELVEKYEALLEVHRQPMMRKAAATDEATLGAGPTASGNNTPVDSCQPQQLGGDPITTVESTTAPRYMIEFGPAMGVGDGPPEQRRAECSEAETASSGYSDEVSNKATQTDESPRNFLCTIADGKDWRFSIYEDESAIDSRFRFSPAHRELFREIFSVLRKAAENRDEGDQLPLLDDAKPTVGAVVARGGTSTVPPVTPANEEPPGGCFPTGTILQKQDEEEDDDETVSFVSSSAVSEQSFAMSECITKSERRRIARQAKAASRYAEDLPEGDGQQLQQQHHPLQQPVSVDGRAHQMAYQPLDYISVAVGVNKRKSRRRSHRREVGQDGPGVSPQTPQTPTSSRTGSTRKHRPCFRPWNPERDGDTGAVSGNTSTRAGQVAEWNGDSLTIYNRTKGRPGPTSTPAIPAQSPAVRSRRSSEKKRNQSGARNRYADLADNALGEDVFEFRPSSASQHLHKLQKLDLSYAEVLRRADGGQPFAARRQYKPQ